jgi:hypothetical protein
MEEEGMIPKRLILHHRPLTVGGVLAMFGFKVGLVVSRNVLAVQGVGRTHVIAEGLRRLVTG